MSDAMNDDMNPTFHDAENAAASGEGNGDTLQKFMFENASLRGEFVEISDTWRQVQARSDYPQAIRTMLGQMLAAAALLAANLKFDGVIVMQIHGDGPVRLMVVECDSALRLRATAKFSAEALEDAAADGDALSPLAALVNRHGKGRFVITLDPNDRMPGQQAYQGIVPLDGDSIATVIENYMLRSEQLDTKLWLAADENVSRGLLLQKMPGDGGIHLDPDDPLHKSLYQRQLNDADTWNRAVMLASTLKPQEMLDTDIGTLMQRLFWEESVRIFTPRHPRFHCTCTREKVGNMLKMLGREEIDSALDELDKLGVNCDFCGLHYDFDRVDCAQLFADDSPVEGLIAAGDVKH
jgi:molecular chaperone Hsp33